MSDTQDSNKDWGKIQEGEDSSIDILDRDEESANESEAPSLDHPSYKELEDKLTAAEMKVHENWDKATRAVAELENVRRRMELEVEKAHKFSVEKLIKEIIPVIDSLEHAITASADASEAMKEGVELTHKLFLDALRKFAVEAIDPMGQPFNPEWHEAMTMQPAPEVPNNTVVAVFQKGYQLHGRVIRPARVVIAKND